MSERDLRAALAHALPGEHAPVLDGIEVEGWTYDAGTDCLCTRFGEMRLSCTLGPVAAPFGGRALWLHVADSGTLEGWTMERTIPAHVFGRAAESAGGGAR